VRITQIIQKEYYSGGILPLMDPVSIYLHIPFCHKRCSYCDFNTYTGQEGLIPGYIKSLSNEIRLIARKNVGRINIHTIFFGGGTPSLLSPDQISKILTTIDTNYKISSDPEITIEANPGTLSREYLENIVESGVNRISLGMQTHQNQKLRLLGRSHNHQDVITAVKWIRQAKIGNLSLDLIFGLPGQSLSDWKSTLKIAVDLSPEHLSIYALTIEDGTLMKKWESQGLILPVSDDGAAEMYEYTSEILSKAGFSQYEISNWAKKGSTPQTGVEDFPLITKGLTYESRHNLQYWRNLPYMGFGAGAHGYFNSYRTINVMHPEVYIKKLSTNPTRNQNIESLQTPATQEIVRVDLETEIRETMMMGLRLTNEGVSGIKFQERFGISMSAYFEIEIERFVQWGLLEWHGDILRLTPRGRLLGNQVFAAFT
jgi:oxygen-independent coproporphyrinogen-3 oxidase